MCKTDKSYGIGPLKSARLVLFILRVSYNISPIKCAKSTSHIASVPIKKCKAYTTNMCVIYHQSHQMC